MTGFEQAIMVLLVGGFGISHVVLWLYVGSMNEEDKRKSQRIADLQERTADLENRLDNV